MNAKQSVNFHLPFNTFTKEYTGAKHQVQTSCLQSLSFLWFYSQPIIMTFRLVAPFVQERTINRKQPTTNQPQKLLAIICLQINCFSFSFFAICF